MKYVLISPARNEAAFVHKTLDSMVAQTFLPERWIIVDDGSTDGTTEIVEAYAKRYSWIELVRRPKHQNHNFAGKVYAFNAGLERVQALEFDIIGCLDADLSFDPDYLEFLMQKFAEDPHLGVAGTPFIENGYDSAKDSFEGQNHVAGGCQLFRRRCYSDIGGYVANRAGGIDWIAVTTARMMGWRTRSFPERRFQHYRRLGTAERNELKAAFSYGEKDYYLGNSPLWQLFRVGYRMAKPPYVVEGMALLAGFCWAALLRTKRPISPELMRFHRGEQMQKLGIILQSALRFKKVDNFRLVGESPTVKANAEIAQAMAIGAPNGIVITPARVDAPAAAPAQRP
jgi:glycosyltransferase involved in cell wall biosynthesis